MMAFQARLGLVYMVTLSLVFLYSYLRAGLALKWLFIIVPLVLWGGLMVIIPFTTPPWLFDLGEKLASPFVHDPREDAVHTVYYLPKEPPSGIIDYLPSKYTFVKYTVSTLIPAVLTFFYYKEVARWKVSGLFKVSSSLLFFTVSSSLLHTVVGLQLSQMAYPPVIYDDQES